MYSDNLYEGRNKSPVTIAVSFGEICVSLGWMLPFKLTPGHWKLCTRSQGHVLPERSTPISGVANKSFRFLFCQMEMRMIFDHIP